VFRSPRSGVYQTATEKSAALRAENNKGVSVIYVLSGGKNYMKAW
jgi:hypothetical protein